jgi:carbon monoxide dehydrogenase subunit G
MTRSLLLLLACLLYVGQSFAHGPSRLKVEESMVVKAPAAKVWALIGDFCTIDKWAPGIVKSDCQGGNEVGASRVLTIGQDGGAQIAEELQKYDAAAMSMKYKITKTDMAVLPVTTYSSFLSVKDNGDGTSTVDWRAGFYRGHPNNNPPAEQNDEAATKAVTGAYQGGLAHIKELVEK